MLIRLNVDQVRVVGLWGFGAGSADMGPGQHKARMTWVRPTWVGPTWVGPTRGQRRQLSLENSKINQINKDFGYFYIKTETTECSGLFYIYSKNFRS